MKIEKIMIIIIATILIFYSYEVNAATSITPTSTELGYSFYNMSNETTTTEGVLSAGQTLGNSATYVETTSGTKIRPWLYTLKPRVFYNFNSGGTYNFSFYVSVNYENTTLRTTAERFNEYMTLSVRASNKSNGSSAVASNIATYKCDYIQDDDYANRFYINCNVTFKSDMKYIVFFFYMKDKYRGEGAYNQLLAITNLRYDSYSITFDESSAGAINNQTQVIIQGNTEINNNLNDIENAITGEHEYENNPSEEIEGKNEIDEMKELEENILGNLDFSGTENLNITINPNTSRFIWDIVEQLRGINSKIVMLITSILGLGIIKMILNR